MTNLKNVSMCGSLNNCGTNKNIGVFFAVEGGVPGRGLCRRGGVGGIYKRVLSIVFYDILFQRLCIKHKVLV